MTNRLPVWMRQKAPQPSMLTEMKTALDSLSIYTVCENAECPNQGFCFSRGTATFLILGNVCTRNCRFCAIEKGLPLPLKPDEPENVAKAVSKLKLKHAVITSVTRDDLADGGARHFARTIDAIRKMNPQTRIEVLIPDFQGSLNALKIVVKSHPDIVNHNVETVPRLYSKVRLKASYQQSINLIKCLKEISPAIVTKSGIMLGLGETRDEVVRVIEDLHRANCDMLTLGQYLQPSTAHYPVHEYIAPSMFEEYRKLGLAKGFSAVASSPLVRSSFNAAEMYATSC